MCLVRWHPRRGNDLSSTVPGVRLGYTIRTFLIPRVQTMRLTRGECTHEGTTQQVVDLVVSRVAMRTVALSIFNPALASGRALSQSPDPGEHEATRRACSTKSEVKFKRASVCTLQHKSSQLFCSAEVGVDGDGQVGQDASLFQVDNATAIPPSPTSRRRAGSRADVSSAVLAAEAR